MRLLTVISAADIINYMKNNEANPETTMKTKVERSKIRLTLEPNGINYAVTDTNRTRRCTASILNVASNGWNVRIDKNGRPWKYAANIPTATPEAAYEYCHEFGEKV